MFISAAREAQNSSVHSPPEGAAVSAIMLVCAGQAAMISHPLHFVVPQFGWLMQFRDQIILSLYLTQPLGAPFDLCTDRNGRSISAAREAQNSPVHSPPEGAAVSAMVVLVCAGQAAMISHPLHFV